MLPIIGDNLKNKLAAIEAGDRGGAFKKHLPVKLFKKMAKYAGGEKKWRIALGKYEKEIDKLSKEEKDKIIKELEDHIRMMMKKAWRCSGKKKFYKNL